MRQHANRDADTTSHLEQANDTSTQDVDTENRDIHQGHSNRLDNYLPIPNSSGFRESSPRPIRALNFRFVKNGGSA